MIEDQSYEDEDSDLMLEIVDRANLSGLSCDQMEEALEAALLDESSDIEDRLRDLRDFFHTKIYKEGIAANRLQRLIRGVVMRKDTMKKIERMEQVLHSLIGCAEVTCPETMDSSKRACAVRAIVKKVADILCETYGVSDVLRLTSNDVRVFTVTLYPENEQGIECTFVFETNADSPVDHVCMGIDDALITF